MTRADASVSQKDAVETPPRPGKRARLPRRVALAALTLLFTSLVGGAAPAGAQTTPTPPDCPNQGANPDEWLDTEGMTLNHAPLTSGNPAHTLYNGCHTPPGWLFDDPADANDPWHWLPMTRWTRVNDFFSTSEGGLLSLFNNVLSASYTTLVAMAFTLASFAWAITVWLVRMMVGAPTLAAEFMSRLYDSFYDYAGAVFATGWAYLVVALAVMAAAWRMARGRTGREAARTVMGALLPLGLLAGLMTFHTDVEDANGGMHTVSGPEWVFATALRLSTYAADPVAEFTDYLTSDDWEAPEQLVTCDAYVAVLEGNFIRSWRTKGDHRESLRVNPGNPGSDFVSAPASAVYQWAETSDRLRMRLALIVSRIWERSYAVGWGRAQFGDSTAARRAYCLIADWRSRHVTPLEQLAIWRETCYLQTYHQALALGNRMALTGCSIFPQIKAPEDGLSNLAASPRSPAAVIDAYCSPSSANPGVSRDNWLLPPGSYTERTRDQEECKRLWLHAISVDLRLLDDPRFHSLASFAAPAEDNLDDYYKLVNEDQHRAAEIYASAVFNPSSPVVQGDRFALRTIHGVFAACDFTDWLPEDYHDESSLIQGVNENDPPPYPNHGGRYLPNSALGNVTPGDVEIPSAAVIPDVPKGSGGVVRVDHRMWGLGFDGYGHGSAGDPEEIISPNACLAFLFGSGANDMDYDGKEEERIQDDGVAHWPYDGLGIHDDSTDASNGYPEFRWETQRYPTPQAWLDKTGSGSKDEYPGANNRYVINRLGRTPEEYRDSALVWPSGAFLIGHASNNLPPREPSLAASQAGAGVFEAIHGRSRAENGMMAILAVLVAFAYMFALAGLSLGSALSVVILALLVAILPVLLLVAALPLDAARALPKKMLKLGFGAAFSYSLFLLFVSLVLLITDLLLAVVTAMGARSGEFWYTALLGAIPLVALYAVGSLGKQFGLNITSAKGAFMFTSGMAMANIKEPNARSATRYGRMGAMALAGGTIGQAIHRGARGAAARTTPRVGAASGGGGAAEAAAAGAAMGLSPRRSRSAVSDLADRATGRGPGDFAAGSDGIPDEGGVQPWRTRAASMIAPGSARDPSSPGRIRRARSFVGRHKALTASALLLPVGGVGAAGALYGGAKVSRALGLHHIPRMLTGRRPTQTPPQQHSGAWLKSEVRKTRQRVADRLDSGGSGVAGPEAPIDVDGSGVPLNVSGQYVGYAPPSSDSSHVPQMAWHQGLGREVDMSLGYCGAMTSKDTSCKLPQTECLHHSNADRARAAGAAVTAEQEAASTAELEQRRAQRTSQRQMPPAGICGAPIGMDAVCEEPSATCTRHRSGIDAAKQV